MSEKLKAIVVEGLQTGKSKMEIIADMIRADTSVDLVKAGKIYAEAGKGAGLILDNEARANAVEEIITSHTTDNKLDREAATAALIKKGMTKMTAVQRLKDACEAKNIEFPQATRVKRDMEKVYEAYKKWMADGTSRESIEAGLVKYFGYGKKGVSAAYTQIGRHLGLIEPATSADRAKIADWFANADNVKGKKKDIVERHEKAFKCKTSTAELRYTQYLFAVAYVYAKSQAKAA